MLKGTVEQTAAGWELRTGIVVIGPVPGLAETGHIGARRVLEKLRFWVDAPSVDLASGRGQSVSSRSGGGHPVPFSERGDENERVDFS